ncbi:hypothetical protein C1645_838017, partial [Glomus cerebriforme]
MNNKKCKITSVANLIKYNKKCKIETSVADLIKPKKKYLYTCHYVNPTETNSNQLKKRKRDNPDSFQLNKPDNKEDILPDSFPDSFQPNKPDNEKDIPPDSFPDSFQPNKPDNEEDIPPDSFPDSFHLNNEEKSINTSFSSNFRISALTLDKNDN